MSENVGTLNFRNPKGLHGLYSDNIRRESGRNMEKMMEEKASQMHS
jgi:hypothetical protein